MFLFFSIIQQVFEFLVWVEAKFDPVKSIPKISPFLLRIKWFSQKM